MLLQVRYPDFYAHQGALMLFSAVDLWEHLAIATQPDQRVGRRGSELSICKSHTHLFISK